MSCVTNNRLKFVQQLLTVAEGRTRVLHDHLTWHANLHWFGFPKNESLSVYSSLGYHKQLHVLRERASALAKCTVPSNLQENVSTHLSAVSACYTLDQRCHNLTYLLVARGIWSQVLISCNYLLFVSIWNCGWILLKALSTQHVIFVLLLFAESKINSQFLVEKLIMFTTLF